jgi:hypothetical protein
LFLLKHGPHPKTLSDVDATLAQKTFHHIDSSESRNPANIPALSRQDTELLRIKCQVLLTTKGAQILLIFPSAQFYFVGVSSWS